MNRRQMTCVFYSLFLIACAAVLVAWYSPAVSACEGVNCVTRTPGYWGNHPDVTAQLLPVTSCGLEIMTFSEVVQDLCISSFDAKKNGVSTQELSLIRQCTAAELNLSATAFFGGNCEPAVPYDSDVLAKVEYCCDVLCTREAPDIDKVSRCIDFLDRVNNSSRPDDPLDMMDLCPNAELGTDVPCGPDWEQCQEANGDGIINSRP